MTSDLKPDLLWVTSSCDSLCSDAEKNFFELPILFSASLRMRPGSLHKVFANLFDAEYIIECKSLRPIWFLKGIKDALQFNYRSKEHLEGMSKAHKAN